MSFSEEQIKLLDEPILAEDIKTREAFGSGVLSYIAGHHAIDEANRIFGFDGWSTEILTLREVNKISYVKPPYKSGDKEKPMVSIAYMCTLRLTVGACTHEDVGFGDGVAGDTASGMSSAIELASKESVTDAIKRCLRAFGNKFGNSLYNKDADAPIGSDTYQSTMIVSADQLIELSKLIDKRGVDENWAIAWLAGEGWTEPLTALRQDWYDSVYRAVDAIGLEERQEESYVADYDNIKKLMNESVSFNMLKGLFADGWAKTTKQKDKERQLELQKIYESKKEEFNK